VGDRPGGNFDRNHFNNVTNNFNRFNHNGWHHGDWHDHWHGGWYNHPWAWWGAGMATGLVASAIPWSWGYWGYSNPYASEPIVVDNSTIDYSQPILAYEAPSDVAATDASAADAAPAPVDLATQEFDEAREAFAQGDYAAALSKVNQAIARVPNDTSLHEFRGLVLFATGKYQDAAAAIYAVLSAGPGWNWSTLSGLYPSIDVYTQQLRALEAYRKQHPDASYAHFLLAYQYLTCGKTEAAAKELKDVVRINPQDPLAAQLLAGLQPADPNAPPPQPAEPPAPGKPVTTAELAGNWTAQKPDGSSISLQLGADSKFAWKYTQNGKSHDFGGSYTVADNLLVLNQNNTPAMVGQVSGADGKRFNFHLAGSPPGDPGLTFMK
jgi:tetratricopeptide (TPR) repeat protein